VDNADAVKLSLRNAQWRKVGELTVEGEAGIVTLFIRRPPPKVIFSLFEECRKEGLLTDKNEPTSELAGLDFSARLCAPMLFLPGGLRPLLTSKEFEDMPWFLEAVEACQTLVLGAKEVEAARGNS